MQDRTDENFLLNLKLACSYFTSVSELCRKLAINRQQFMKYLTGRAYPSRHTMRRLCDFLGFDEHELLMPHDQFREIITLRPVGAVHELELPERMTALMAQLRRSDSKLKILNGYYFQYYFSFSTRGYILRALVNVYDWRGYTFYRRIERLRSEAIAGPPDIYKYDGIVTMVGDKIHMIDQEAITKNELSHAILYPSYRNRATLLTGLIVGVSGKGVHQPAASRVLLEYVGRTVNRRRAIEGCRLYASQSPDVPEVVQEFLLSASADAGGITRPGPIHAS
ncbi:helix-turn-helix domain-containing protein [Mongoliimonas terrestris]|uniref:helix-turn-helix domain-containing protein n=1 Tax=Mongoliimonas terrestris TaxID=1709001 RepID=UPI0009495623|nr:helix-turn-helix domain-containing protein [Mongoliimonas terrestris]